MSFTKALEIVIHLAENDGITKEKDNRPKKRVKQREAISMTRELLELLKATNRVTKKV